jgi:hypothetical protein
MTVTTILTALCIPYVAFLIVFFIALCKEGKQSHHVREVLPDAHREPPSTPRLVTSRVA